MRHASLFSGIGGFDLAAEWMGWENVFQVEIDPFCQAVLKKNFPTVERYGDIKQFDGTKYRGTVDILTGGFPCQPFSVAGPRAGKNDNRYLWPEFIRTIREVRPSFVVCENVPGIINMAFETVCIDLENEDYKVESFIIPACGIGAIHKRNRVWIIAYTNGIESSSIRGNISQMLGIQEEERQPEHCTVVPGGNTSADVTNPNSERLPERQRNSGMDQGPANGYTGEIVTLCDAWPVKPGICRRDDGIPNRVDRIKSLGNAIVPQVAFEIFKAIERTFVN